MTEWDCPIYQGIIFRGPNVISALVIPSKGTVQLGSAGDQSIRGAHGRQMHLLQRISTQQISTSSSNRGGHGTKEWSMIMMRWYLFMRGFTHSCHWTLQFSSCVSFWCSAVASTSIPTSSTWGSEASLVSVLNESSVGQFHYDNYGLCQTILCIIQIPLLMTGRRKWGSAMVVIAVLLCTINWGTREVHRNVSLQMDRKA